VPQGRQADPGRRGKGLTGPGRPRRRPRRAHYIPSPVGGSPRCQPAAGCYATERSRPGSGVFGAELLEVAAFAAGELLQDVVTA
jgi:hypothetical protein